MEKIKKLTRSLYLATAIFGVATAAGIHKLHTNAYYQNMDKIEEAGINLPPSIFGIGERRRY